jgi:hypothetical protein
LNSTFGFRLVLASNYLLRTLIRVFVTWGITALPLNRNLIPRFIKRGGAQETMMNDTLIVEIREYQNSREEDLHGFPCSFSFCAWVTESVVECGHVVFIT